MEKVKEYLKMSDIFPFALSFDSDGGIGAVVDSQGEYIAQAMENNYCSHMSNKDKNGYRNKVARYVAHSVESHDELVNQRNELLTVIELVLSNASWVDIGDTYGIGIENSDFERLKTTIAKIKEIHE